MFPHMPMFAPNAELIAAALLANSQRSQRPLVVIHSGRTKISCDTPADARAALDAIDETNQRRRQLVTLKHGLDPRPASQLRREVAALK